MATRHVLGTECVFPEVEGALTLRTLQPLAFTQAGDIDTLARRPLDCFDDIVIPCQAPARLRQRIDARHTFPACIAIAQAGRVGLMHELDDGAGAGLDARRARQAPPLVLEKRAGDVVLSSRQPTPKSPSLPHALSRPPRPEPPHRT